MLASIGPAGCAPLTHMRVSRNRERKAGCRTLRREKDRPTSPCLLWTTSASRKIPRLHACELTVGRGTRVSPLVVTSVSWCP